MEREWERARKGGISGVLGFTGTHNIGPRCYDNFGDWFFDRQTRLELSGNKMHTGIEWIT